jgi:hypothetical protein
MRNTLGVGNTTQYLIAGSTNPQTFTHTVASQNDRKLILVHCNRGGDLGNSITYNGVAMTLIIRSPSNDQSFTEIWYLDNPDTGSNTVSINFAAGPTGNEVIGVIDIYNAEAGLPSDQDTQTGVSSFTNSVPVSINGSIIIEGMYSSTNALVGVNQSGQVEFAKIISNDGGGSSYKLNVNTPSSTVGWNMNTSSAYSQAAITVAPSLMRGGSFLYNLI